MNASPELATAERELAVARRSFNTAHRALDTTLSRLGAREGATDRLIHHADEYGVDHTVTVLSKTPQVFDFNDGIPDKDMPAVRSQLKAAYEAVHAVDLAMAKVENLLHKGNPNHAKGILVSGKAYVFDPKKELLHGRDSGETIKAEASHVKTEEDGGPARKREQDRDR